MLLDLYANHHEHEINAKETLQECLSLIKKTEGINKLQHDRIYPILQITLKGSQENESSRTARVSKGL